MNITMNMTNVDELIAALQAEPELMNALAGCLTILYILAVVSVVYLVARYLLRAIGCCTMYHKAGVACWKAFIPFYNTYNNYKISWNGKMFFLFAALVAVSSFLGAYTEGALALAGTAASLGAIVLFVKQNLNMAKCFGKGAGTGIALILFPGITSLILGLGNAEYTAIAG